ncbi:MAG: glycerol-3-phosphate dehydrogenase/oxidase [Cyclobacteriaceae bacterium]|nr:glycerol-3-phosphate dehydrogenase/oxidase [Cyclobacteriaceae bacterium]MCH8517081.1 glycerol-3-phosphate dehydrogenase/oxidase [Cyclobacteriaceae bacterium]
MNRDQNLEKLSQVEQWDVVIIGGGSSGLGAALDALSRGLSVLLLEKSDFAKGTSSRSTKLLHGGVRYLAQGHIGLVLEALRERGLLLKNAPHLSNKQAFTIPIFSWFDRLKYTIGLKLYDYMSGKLRIGKSKFISKSETIERLPGLKQDGLIGGVVYYDGQFDDARLALSIAQTCDQMGGVLINYAKVVGLEKNDQNKLTGLSFKDEVNDKIHQVKAKAVINATGVFADKILQMDQPGSRKMIQPSQGVHLVIDRKFMNGTDALMIPETRDGRVLFAVPWQDTLVLGTTDTLVKKASQEPQALEEEIEFILNTAKAYMSTPPQRSDVKSVFAGLRPLAAPKDDGEKTKEISRSHKVFTSKSGLVSITGGKWTTFRQMGEDTIDEALKVNGLSAQASASASIRLYGATEMTNYKHKHWRMFGDAAKEIQKIIDQQPELAEPLHSSYPYLKADVVYSIREEMPQRVEDVLSRRFRILVTDATVAYELSESIAKLMAEILKKDSEWIATEMAHMKKTTNKYILKAS